MNDSSGRKWLGGRMSKVTINEREYDLDSMSQESKLLLESIQFVDEELKRNKRTWAALTVARRTYSDALSVELGLNTQQDVPADYPPQNITFD